MKLRFLLLLLSFAAWPLFGDGFIPPAQKEKAAPGDTVLTEYFRNETAAVSARCLADIKTLDDWKAKRDEYRRQFQEMLGLWPMPVRTDLKPVVTGSLTNDEFTVEKISFQASPGLYCTANLYLPKHLTNPAPTILYECGHLRQMTNGISYGNKASYQADGPWFARNGYVCLVMDTLRDGEIQGLHTGTRDLGLWWWNSRGYTPAGVEAWFGIRALDFLSTRPEVDTNRFGITGHSGGGTYSWSVAALDDRIQAAAPLSGMTDLKHHIVDNLMDSHCDCNFPINLYRWDFPQEAALVAPRPLLIGGTDNDHLFPLDGTVALHEKVRRLYQLYGANTNLALAFAPGPHAEMPELQLAVLRWFNRHLKGVKKGVETPIVVDVKTHFGSEQLRVFTNPPADAINRNIADTFVPLASQQESSPSPRPSGERAGARGVESDAKHLLTPSLSPAGSGGEGGRPVALKQSEGGTPEKGKTDSADELRGALREKVFAGWPADDLPLETKRVFAVERGGARFGAWDFTSQHDVKLRFYLLEKAMGKVRVNNFWANPNAVPPVRLNVLAQPAWTNWLGAMRAVFNQELANELAGTNLPAADPAAFEKLKREVMEQRSPLAFFAPRGVGLTAWSGDEKRLTKIRRRFALLGQTLDGMRVWDIRRAMQAIHSARAGSITKIELRADGTMAVNALYAALFEPDVKKLELINLPKSQREGPDYLGVLKLTDIPQVAEAVGQRAEVTFNAQPSTPNVE